MVHLWPGESYSITPRYIFRSGELQKMGQSDRLPIKRHMARRSVSWPHELHSITELNHELSDV